MRRRVLVLIKGLGRGGAEQILASSAPHLERSTFDYRVAYLLPWKDALVKELEDAGVPTTCLRGARGPGWVGRLRDLVAQGSIDIVHAHSPVAAVGARLAFRSRSRRPRLVYTEHNVWERYHPATRWANHLTFARNDHVFAVSDHVRDSIRCPRGLRRRPPPPIETLYHGIDPDAVTRWAKHDGVRAELGIPADAPVVGTVANFKAHKRLDVLVGAASLIRRRFPDVRVVLVGQGPLEGEIRRRARAFDLDDTVIFTGFRADAPRIAASFDVFAMTSEFEGLSIAVIEALALGRPSVVTAVGGLPELIEDGRQGYLVPSGDARALADRVVELLSDADLRSRMGAMGRARAADFDIRRSIQRVEQVYGELLA